MKNNKKKLIRYIQSISPYLAGKLAFYNYIRAIKIPIRQLESRIMNEATVNEIIINGKKIKIYSWGENKKPVLLVHGWGSRASRLYLLIKALRDENFKPITFDAPGHGDSEGNSTDIIEYFNIINFLAIEEGGFEAVIAHSLGVLYSMYALKQGIKTNKFIAISGVSELDYTIKNFTKQTGLNKKTHQNIRKKLEKYFKNENNIWEKFSAYSEPKIDCNKILLMHDKDDEEVELRQSKLLFDVYKDVAKFHITEALGHIRILMNEDVVRRVITHIKI